MLKKKIKVVLNEEYVGYHSGWPTRYMGILLQLKKHFDLYLYAPGSTTLLQSEFSDSWVCESTSSLHECAKGSRHSYIKSIISPNPNNIFDSDFVYYRQFQEFLEDDISSNRETYDVSIYFGMSGYIIYGQHDKTKNIICDFCDSRIRAINSKIIHTNIMREKFSLLIQKYYIKRIKKKLLPKNISGIAITKNDADEISRSFSGEMLVVQNGISDISEISEKYVQKKFESRTLLFLGGLDFAPNILAVQILLEKVWPEIIKRHSNLSIKIVGRRPTEQVISLINATDGATLYNDVESTTPYYEQAFLFVVPIYIGAGMKNKVLEALATGTPVITTTEAAKGIDIKESVHGYYANNDQEFIKTISYMAELDVDRYFKLCQSASDLAKSCLWESRIKPLIKLINQ